MDPGSFTYCLDGFTHRQDGYTGTTYYAWANLDDTFYGWVVVTIHDGGEKQNSAITQEEVQGLLELASPYQIPTAQTEVEGLLNKLDL